LNKDESRNEDTGHAYDQHGTAIISAAALLNALDLQNKKIHKAVYLS
jgi:malic enzyme